jgi:hypothetical protein
MDASTEPPSVRLKHPITPRMRGAPRIEFDRHDGFRFSKALDQNEPLAKRSGANSSVCSPAAESWADLPEGGWRIDWVIARYHP